jgi:hypothetical protein
MHKKRYSAVEAAEHILSDFRYNLGLVVEVADRDLGSEIVQGRRFGHNDAREHGAELDLGNGNDFDFADLGYSGHSETAYLVRRGPKGHQD